MLLHLHSGISTGPRREVEQLHILGLAQQTFLERRKGTLRLLGAQQNFRQVVMQLPVVGVFNHRALKEGHSGADFFGLNQNLAHHCGDHRMLDARGFKRCQFTFGASKITLAQHRSSKAVTGGGFRRIFALDQC